MKKFFYDYFTEEDICGMYTPEHFFTIALFFAVLVVALYLSRKASFKTIRRIHLTLAIIVTLGEVVKDGIQLYKGNEPSSWLPLFYCSLFVYAVWLAYSPSKIVSAIGMSYITLGGTMAGIFFTFYPSTSLVWYPIWHPLSIYGFVYHLIMTYCGLLFLIRGYFKPTARHSIHYFVFIGAACIPSAIFNAILGSNCMFLRDPMNLPIFTQILEASPLLWALFAIVGQAVLMYWLNYGIYRLVLKIIGKYKEATP